MPGQSVRSRHFPALRSTRSFTTGVEHDEVRADGRSSVTGAADKAAHFIMVADSFHLPIIFLADNPGMLPGSRSERSGILRIIDPRETSDALPAAV